MNDDTALSGAATAILRQFPGPVTLYPSRFKFIVAAVFLALVVVMCAFVAWPAATDGELGTAVLGTITAFGLSPFVVLYAASVNRNWMFMTLDADGFEVRRPFKFNSKRYSWKDVDCFSPSYASWSMDTYGLRAGDLVQLLTTWRERALALPRHL
jgi:hypothetical protein